MTKRPVQIFALLSRIVFIVAVIANFCLPVVENKTIGTNVWNVIVLGLWSYALLSSLGYFKTVVSSDEDGCTVYTTAVPIVKVGIVRIVEFFWYYFSRKQNISYRDFITLVVIDVIYMLLLLVDKSSYYYVSMEEDEYEK